MMLTPLFNMLRGNNGDLDEARVMALMLVLTFIGGAAANVWHGLAFDYQQFGIGAGALGAGVGAWMGFRRDN